MATVGHATIRIVADARGFAADAERAINREVNKIDVKTTKIDRDVNRSMVRSFGNAAGSALQAFGIILQGGISVKAAGAFGGAVLAALLPLMTVAGALLGSALILGLGTGLAGLGIFFAAQSKEIRSLFKALFSDLGNEMERISQPIVGTREQLAQVIGETFATFLGPLEASFAALAPVLNEFIMQLGEAFEALAPAIEPIMFAFGRLLEELGPVLAEEVFPDIAEALIELAEAVAGNAEPLADLIGFFLAFIEQSIQIITTLTTLAGWFADNLPAAIATAAVAVGAIGAAIGLLIAGPIGALIGAIVGLVVVVVLQWDNIKKFSQRAWISIVKTLHSAWNSIVSTVRGALSSVFAAIQFYWNSFTSTIRGAQDDIYNTILRGWNAVMNFIGSIPGKIASVARGMFDSIVASFKNAINGIIGAWNGLSFTLPAISVFGKTLGGGTIGTPDIPYLQGGGLIERSGIARVGEGGPETVLLPAGAQVVPNSAGNPFTDEFTATAVIDLGEGVQRVFDIKFQRESRRVANHARIGTGRLVGRTA